MLYQLSYTPKKNIDSNIVVNKDGCRKEGGPSSHHIKGAQLCMRLVLRSKRRIRARVSTPARKRPYSTLLVSCLHSLKILSTKEGQRGILKLLSLTPSTRRWGRLSFRPPYGSPPEKGRSSYLCNYGLCWPLFRSSTLFSLLCSIESYQTSQSKKNKGLPCRFIRASEKISFGVAVPVLGIPSAFLSMSAWKLSFLLKQFPLFSWQMQAIPWEFHTSTFEVLLHSSLSVNLLW